MDFASTSNFCLEYHLTDLHVRDSYCVGAVRARSKHLPASLPQKVEICRQIANLTPLLYTIKVNLPIATTTGFAYSLRIIFTWMQTIKPAWDWAKAKGNHKIFAYSNQAQKRALGLEHFKVKWRLRHAAMHEYINQEKICDMKNDLHTHLLLYTTSLMRFSEDARL